MNSVDFSVINTLSCLSGIDRQFHVPKKVLALMYITYKLVRKSHSYNDVYTTENTRVKIT
jgi:hypothetical protein